MNVKERIEDLLDRGKSAQRKAILELVRDVCDEVVGEDEVMATKEFGLDPEEVFMPSDIIRTDRNDLRAEQRTKLKTLLGGK